MQQAGEYPHPLVRKTVVFATMISGYVGVRLQSQDRANPAISGQGDIAFVTMESASTGTNYTVLQMQQTNDRISGPRSNLGSAVVLVSGGQQTFTIQPIQSFLEVRCTSGGPTNLRMQIDAQRKWDRLAFDKTDPFVAPQLFQAKEVPGPL